MLSKSPIAGVPVAVGGSRDGARYQELKNLAPQGNSRHGEFDRVNSGELR
jgi:hypothetical protein